MLCQVDLQLESGEYFLSEEQRKLNKVSAKKAQATATSARRKAEKEADFVAPKVSPTTASPFVFLCRPLYSCFFLGLGSQLEQEPVESAKKRRKVEGEEKQQSAAELGAKFLKTEKKKKKQ